MTLLNTAPTHCVPKLFTRSIYSNQASYTPLCITPYPVFQCCIPHNNGFYNNGFCTCACVNYPPTRVCPIRHTTCIVLSNTLKAMPPLLQIWYRFPASYTTNKPLEKALGVNAFDLHQLASLVQHQTMPKEIIESEKSKNTRQEDSIPEEILNFIMDINE